MIGWNHLPCQLIVNLWSWFKTLYTWAPWYFQTLWQPKGKYVVSVMGYECQNWYQQIKIEFMLHLLHSLSYQYPWERHKFISSHTQGWSPQLEVPKPDWGPWEVLHVPHYLINISFFLPTFIYITNQSKQKSSGITLNNHCKSPLK